MYKIFNARIFARSILLAISVQYKKGFEHFAKQPQ